MLLGAMIITSQTIAAFARRCIIFCVLMSCSIAAANAQNVYYVRSGASGNGSDWNNAYGALPSALQRGATYYVADGNYSGYTFDDAASGTTVTVIKKATAGDHGTETGWQATYGDGQAVFSPSISFTTNYWRIDGNNGAGPHGCGFKVANSSSAAYTVKIQGPDNITVRYVEVDGMGSTETGQGISWWSDAQNITISRCYLHDTPDDPLGAADGCANFVVEYCTIGPRGNSAGTHGDCFALTRTRGGVFRYNKVNWNGQQLWFGEGPHSGTYEVYGNVFCTDVTTPVGSCTAIKGHSTATPGVLLVYHNTFVNINDFANEFGDGASVFRNNLYYDLNNKTVSFGGKTHSHNWFQTGMSYGTEATAQTGSDPFVNFAALDYTLKANTSPGEVLGAPYDVDMYGRQRTTRTRGAYEFASLSGTPVVAASPSSLAFGSVTTGATKDLTVTVQNTGGGTLSGTATTSSPFSIVGSANYSLGAGQTQVLTVRYSPTQEGTHSGTLALTGGGAASVALAGTGVVTPPPSPVIAVSPATLPFGGITVGSTKDLSLTVQNTGAGTLSGSAVVNAPFSIVSGGTYNLAGGQSQNVVVRYTPVTAGNHSANVVFSGGNGASIAVSGSATSVSLGLSFAATAGTITSPFVVNSGVIYQPSETTMANGGRAAYTFTVPTTGQYAVGVMINAPTDAANSIFVNIDAEPTDPYMIWDVPLTVNFQNQFVGWRGNGTYDNNEFKTKVFQLTAGSHQLIVIGREGNTKIESFSIEPVPSKPTNLRVVASQQN